MADSMIQQITTRFHAQFGEDPAAVIRAPGRVNLIGEHTDYNDGFVMPMAIDRAIWLACRPRDDRQIVLHALDFDDVIRFSLDDLVRAETSPAEYVKGVAWALQDAGHTLAGFEGVFMGDIPIGAGLSSSAALELAVARAFAHVSGIPWDAPHMARLAQRAENAWVGMNCGIMDQLISAVGEAGHAVLIDCRTLDTHPTPLPPGTAVVILDTGTRRGLVDSAYNERRTQCEEAAAFFGQPALRDVSPSDFEAREGEMSPLTRKRARHIITENARTLKARDAMLAGDALALGALMQASHTSLRDDFEVSSEALNTMVEIALRQPGCFGARMTGAGFGGCAVALVSTERVETFSVEVAAEYYQQTPHRPAVYVVEAAPGASVEEG